MRFPLGLFLLLVWAGASFAVEKIPGADIFATNAQVLRIRIEISREGIRSLQNDPRKDVVVTVHEGNIVYANVLAHVKGARGSFREINANPALTLNFAKNSTGQRFHGLRKIHLNNSVQDRSFSTENIVGEMFREAGVPTPRATNARLWLNGRDLGFYVVKEGFTKDFLGMYFKDTSGNLYDGGFIQDIDQPLEKDAGDARRGQPDLDALLAATRITDRVQRWEALQKVLDTDRFFTLMAIDNLTWNWDGYVAKHNNYRVYNDVANGRMVFMPHGLDQMFGQAQASIYRPLGDSLVTRALMEIPEASKLARERLKTVFAKHFRLEALTNRLDFLAKRNRPAVEELGRGALREFDGNVAAVRHRIISRWTAVKQQLDNEPAPVRFDQGPVLIKGWHEQMELGNVRHARGEKDGRQCLQISANGQTIASWRSSVTVEPGRYRFEAMAKTARVTALRDPRGEGAGIRISGAQTRGNKIGGDTDWTKLQFDFDAPPGGGDVVLVCESRATRGDVWFDLSSLKVQKLR